MDTMSKPLALVVEDNEDLAAIFSEALGVAGFNSEVLHSGDLALTRLAQAAPSVVVLDLHLPKVGGVKVLREIHADPRLAAVRVVVVTADAQLGDSLRAEADIVLIKPISFSLLRELATRFGALAAHAE